MSGAGEGSALLTGLPAEACCAGKVPVAASCDRRSSAPWPPPPACRSIQQALGLTQDPSSQGEAARNACILLAFLVSLRALVYWVLRRKTAGRWRS